MPYVPFLVAALLTAAPPLGIVYVAEPSGEFSEHCRAVQGGIATIRPARRLHVRSDDGSITVGEAASVAHLPDPKVERLRSAILDGKLFDDDVRHQAAWADSRGSFVSLISDVEETSEGTLIGINAVEWGGGLIWMTDETVRLVAGGNPTGLARDGQDVIVSFGLYHLAARPGRLVRLGLVDGRLEQISSYPLPIGARDVAVRDGLIVAVGAMGPMVIDAAGIMHHRATNHTDIMDRGSDRRHPYTASSVAIDADGAVHVGLSGGYTIYRGLPDSFEYEYYALTEPCRGRGTPR